MSDDLVVPGGSEVPENSVLPDDSVLLTISGGVATITMNCGRNRNALTTQLRGGLRRAFDTAAESPDARVILLTHTGPVFCAGMDLREAAVDPRPGLADFAELLEVVEHSPVPVVARLAGPARAGGLGLVAAADIVVSVDTATFAFTEVRLGVVPAMISGVVLSRITARAGLDLMLTGRPFDAEHAAEIGLINRAVPVDDLEHAVADYVDALLLGEPKAMAATKRIVSRSRRERLPIADLVAISQQFFTSPEAKEGMRAFAGKRPPRWTTSASGQ